MSARWLLLSLTLAVACRANTVRKPTGEDVTVRADIAYAREDPKQKLDVYRPRAVHRFAHARSAPIVVFVHGGYWVSGDRRAPEHGAGLYENIGRALARRGIVTVIPSYRLAPRARAPQMIDDVVRAIAWARTHADEIGGDSDKLFLMGHSAGGQLAALITLDRTHLERHALPPTTLRGTIAASTIWDLVAMRDAQPERFNDSVTYPVFGSEEEQLRRYSPLSHTQEKRPILSLIVAERDFEYLLPQAQHALEALREAETGVTMRLIRGYDHLDIVRRFGEKDDPVVRYVSAFVLQAPIGRK